MRLFHAQRNAEMLADWMGRPSVPALEPDASDDVGGSESLAGSAPATACSHYGAIMTEQQGYDLFLDDYRTPPSPAWVVVKNYDDFCKIISERGAPERISFDHDLADTHYNHLHGGLIPYESFVEKTGYDCAKWLVDYCIQNDINLPACTVHSYNVVGKQNIINVLSDFEKTRGRET
jgi:hypothetical protein